jgi:FixJ family two-component response regulator
MSLHSAAPSGDSPGEPTVYVIDDDSSTREVLAWLMKRNCLRCETFAEPRSFLASYRPGERGCVILDLHMPGMSGLELQRTLNEQGVHLPVIFLSGRADVPKAVEAVKGGAFDFVEKPFDYRRIVALVRECLQREERMQADHERRKVIAARFAQLTQREREVVERVIAGQLNRVIAEELGISIKTVEVHRAHIMEKLGVGSVAELVHATLELRTGTGSHGRA